MTFLTETNDILPRVSRTRLWQVVTIFVVTLLAAVTGPFGTFQSGGFSARLVYWIVAISISLGVALSLKYALRDLLRTPQFWLAELYICLGTTLAFTPFLYAWTLFWFAGPPEKYPSPVWMGVNVLAICMLISGLRYGLPAFAAVTERAEDAPLPRLSDRLCQEARAPILRLEAEGHYVLVVTGAGVERLRMRLTDAIREMDPVEGYCTHRSHWVARSAIARSKIDGGRPVLALSNGDVVPVSRKYQPDLEDAGLFP
ncbi:MAG: LytTR family DNA-binding domain-containing protein [Pseudomonadota bacterium]